MTINNKTILIIQLVFVVTISISLILAGFFPTIELILTIAIVLLIWKSEYRNLLKDLLPFFVLLLTYQSLRGFAYELTPAEIHITDLIDYEKLLFSGVIPAAYFQELLTSTSYSNTVYLIASIFYMSHFVVPLVAAIGLWTMKHELYWPFIVGLLVLSYAAFLTYFFVPAAPPWWATKFGYLVDQPVTLPKEALPIAIGIASPNPVAAIPSLHIAYPTYIVLFLAIFGDRRFLWGLLLPIVVGFSTVVLGHHYVIDLIIGIGYAVGIIFIIYYLLKIRDMH